LNCSSEELVAEGSGTVNVDTQGQFEVQSWCGLPTELKFTGLEATYLQWEQEPEIWANWAIEL
jgi:hypothetical protein